MKKYLAMMLAAFLLFSLTACGGTPAQEPAGEDVETAEEAAEPTTPDSTAIRETEFGPVQGVDNGDHLIWYAVPYGAAPVGELRWTPPQDPAAWTDALDCTEPGEMALQISGGEAAGGRRTA